MIAINEAFTILDNFPLQLKKKTLPLWDARNHILAKTVVSPIDMPPFRQATMDGFAVALHDTLEYQIISEIKAGDDNNIVLQPGEAVKIFTGAAVPDSATAVIPIEKVIVDSDQLSLEEECKSGTNIRPKAAQIQTGAVALEKGSWLNPAAIGFLTGLGLTRVAVFEKPKVGILVTGNELTTPGKPLAHGKIYESNSVMLQAALHDAGFYSVVCYQVTDDFEETKIVLQAAIDASDLVLVSGGISVGDYDFVGKALESLGVETLFYKVNQKPGKPLFVGNKEEKIIFALPGNPAASLSCFYVYVRPMLRKMSGMQHAFGASVTRILLYDYEVNNVRDLILKAKLTGDMVEILPHQDSAMLDSFAVATALVYLPNGNYKLQSETPVSVYII